jgi:hypothetical protein
VLEDDVRDFLSSGATSVIAKPMQQVELERILSGESSPRPLSLFLLSPALMSNSHLCRRFGDHLSRERVPLLLSVEF